jgi:hypothetical protein
MDDIVKQALAKWPNEPHCYCWLNLDARGNWRMRDERAQHFNLPGDKLTNPALVGFIVRNYDHDERGCWYFQNGPQRVYVNLETAPFVARTDPAAGFVLHTGAPLGAIDEAWLTEAGSLVLRSGETVAQLDDRDMAHVLEQFVPSGDEALAEWLDGADVPLHLQTAQGMLPVQRLRSADMPQRFNFQRAPQP